MINILAPTNNPNEVERLIEAGANELYCGVISKTWYKYYTNMGSINRREFIISNLNSFDDLKSVVETAHSYNVPVFLTMNAFYSKKQFNLVLEEAEKALNLDVDAVIVADINLLLELNKIGNSVDLHISTGGTVFNSKTAEFYKGLGVKRIILPRHLTLKEITKISKVKNIDFEIFIMNTRCMNIDGFCTYQHGINEIKHTTVGNIMKRIHFDYMISNFMNYLPNLFDYAIRRGVLGDTSACCLNYNVKVLFNKYLKIKNRAINNIKCNIKQEIGPRQLLNHCGACSLYKLNDIGVRSVKIVGRENPTTKKIRDVAFLKNMLYLIKTKPSKQQFIQRCRLEYKIIYGSNCNMWCYYS